MITGKVRSKNTKVNSELMNEPKGGIDIRLQNLENYLSSLGAIGVAVSGGVDSMTLAYLAHRVNAQSIMFHALSAAVPKQATDRVKAYAQAQGWNLRLINAREMEDPSYVKNPVNRCYFCKSNLYQSIAKKTSLTIVSGTNSDDLNDFRPGLEAAKRSGVLHPYVETGIDKQGVRQLANYFGLQDLHKLPASPCLSSRVSTGIAIDEDLLILVDQAERKINDLLSSRAQLNTVRCRIFSDHITIQLDAEQVSDIDACLGEDIRNQVSELFVSKGFEQYTHTIRIEPYSMGSAFIQLTNLPG